MSSWFDEQYATKYGKNRMVDHGETAPDDWANHITPRTGWKHYRIFTSSIDFMAELGTFRAISDTLFHMISARIRQNSRVVISARTSTAISNKSCPSVLNLPKYILKIVELQGKLNTSTMREAVDRKDQLMMKMEMLLRKFFSWCQKMIPNESFSE